ncbi:MAG: hypothetical protein P8J37_13130 [Fuerstiella sp.]|nr:hypothetical protein [Fuerstiella sp.]
MLIYMVIHGSWTGQLGSGGQGIVSLCLTLPFLLLSGVAGQVADRHSKRDISVLMKVSSHSGLILGAGFSAGFYIIPLQALLQQHSPRSERGRFLGTANAISFAFLTAAALLDSMIRPAFTESETVQHPERIFLVCAALMAAGIVFFLMQVKARGLSLNPVTTHDQH